jgi:mxaJ protein
MKRATKKHLLLGFVLAFGVSGGPKGATAPSLRPHVAAKTLLVCADPAGLPYSNEKEEGFENRIAELIAKELRVTLQYTWWAQRRGFVRNTLNARTCDVVMGAPIGLGTLRTTSPYYRSTFAFLTKKESDLENLRSLDDPRLRVLTIGVPLAGDDGANPAPVHALGRRGITGALRGFPLYGELGRSMPAAAEAVVKGEIDVAILWGPVAGAAAKNSRTPLMVVPVEEETDGAIPLTFAIGMGVRKDDEPLADRLDAALIKKRAEINAVLRAAGVPLLPLSHSSTEATDARL